MPGYEGSGYPASVVFALPRALYPGFATIIDELAAYYQGAVVSAYEHSGDMRRAVWVYDFMLDARRRFLLPL